MSPDALKRNETDRLGATYLPAVTAAVRSVATAFRESPGSFLFEAGVHALLYTRLFDALRATPITWDLAGKGLVRYGSAGSIALNPVQAEYPADMRFDIALIAAETFPDQKAWTQPVRAGIEVKLWQADGVTGQHFRDDRRKLEGYADRAAHDGRYFTGLCVAFAHDREDPRVSARKVDADIVDAEERLELPLHGVRSIVISAGRR